MNSTLVVIPTYNEAGNIALLLQDLLKLNLDILVIDDGSPDGTAKVVIDNHVEVLVREAKLGLGSAYVAGLSIGITRGYSHIVQMDADGSHQIEDLKKMMEWIGSSDLLIGSRWTVDGSIENWSKFRECLSKCANLYTNLMLSIGVKDATSGFRIYESELLKKMQISTIQSQGYCFQIEMTRRALEAGGTVAEIPIIFKERSSGKSKMSWVIAAEAVIRITYWGFLRLIGR